MDKKFVGLKIKELRSRKSALIGKKIRQKDLADQIGVSRSYLGDIESGRTKANELIISKIAKALDVDIVEITTPPQNQVQEPTAIYRINDIVKENKIMDIAAHFDDEDFTDEDVDDIEKFIKYVVAKRKNEI
ncbi:MAG: helix-turn-helix domain-containing protein [Clostridium sp.]